MVVLQFTGEGRGFMGGVTEYITVHEADDPDLNEAREPAPGFTLDNEARYSRGAKLRGERQGRVRYAPSTARGRHRPDTAAPRGGRAGVSPAGPARVSTPSPFDF